LASQPFDHFCMAIPSDIDVIPHAPNKQSFWANTQYCHMMASRLQNTWICMRINCTHHAHSYTKGA